MTTKDLRRWLLCTAEIIERSPSGCDVLYLKDVERLRAAADKLLPVVLEEEYAASINAAEPETEWPQTRTA